MPNIEQYGKGAVVDPKDERDFKAEPILGALPPVDWNTPFTLPEPPNEDQNGSSSCVAQAWSYYHWQLKGNNYSRKDLYSRIFFPQGGAYIRDGGLQIVKNGQATRDELPDPSPESEQAMTAGAATPVQEAHDRELDSFVLTDYAIDHLAQEIVQYKGVVFGVTGSNPGWVDIANPRPPASGESTWGHALYLFGYHLHNGVKCVLAKSSWCNSGTTIHHIKENYLISGNTFSPWTLISKQQQLMNQAKIVKSKTSPTVYICYPVPDMDYLTKTTNLQGIVVPNPIPDSDSL